jgi:carboxypeptidase Taq
VTYNLHVLLRFEMETAAADQAIDVADVPAAWDAKMQAYLASRRPMRPRDACRTSTGAAASSATSPTYSLGNLYASQFFEQRGKTLETSTRCSRAAISEPLLAGCARTSTSTSALLASQLVQRVTETARRAAAGH